ncbi:MAG: SHOCT domain-containing protein [Spirochaetes bacterium]|nr:SHOCT domain-containing protein [Spirochaetota bacterium]
MWNNGYGMMGWGFGGWIIGLLFFIFLTAIVLIIYFALRISKGSLTVSSKDETALDILKKRYAKGEITKKEFIDMKKDL